MSIALDPVGTLDVALSHAARLLAAKPQLAAEQAAEILKVMPRQPTARLLLALAKRSLGAAQEALPQLQELAADEPRYAAAHCELGLLLRQLGFGDAALVALRRAVELEPSLGPAWLALGDLYTDVGDARSADAAYSQHIKYSTRNPRLLAAGAALYGNRLPEAESLLRAHLKQSPTDVAALRMLAEVAGRLRRYRDAEALLQRCVELSPSFTPARHNLALVLHREGKSEAALNEIDGLLAGEPRQPSYRNLKAAILGSIGEYAGSLALYKDLLQDYPSQAKVWMSYGHALKTAGHEREGIAAYRKSIELEPLLGEAYWSLANLKTFRFTDGDIDAMRAALALPAASSPAASPGHPAPATAAADAANAAASPSAPDPRTARLDNHERFHFNFALGKALEDAALYEESFRHYAEGNRLRRTELHYEAEENRARHRRSGALFTRQFFEDRAGLGSEASDPIFIVGLPRSGSTLLEQILSSHSQVEGTMELPDITAMARGLTFEANGATPAKYPDALATLPPGRWRELGEEYLARTRIHRKSGPPYFIDKMPNNFAHIGLIQLALPNSKIIDVRRHPLACCFSGFKQHFAMGQNFSYSLEDIGRYYHDYVQLMAHFDAVLPGRVHRVFYETLVDDTETEVRRLLDYCGLPFEDSCLRFYENSRAVRTASSEQVRRPIFRDGIDQWRHFDPWLAPLKEALGKVLECYPQVPEFA